MAAARKLSGKTVLITGASSGIGRSAAFEFARASPQSLSLSLILAARRIDRLREIAHQIELENGEGVRVHVVQLDVSRPDEVARLVPELPDEFRQIDVLVNNA